mmetsp:Transcript_3275/g.5946  ORF Transcript_3275/g.5946 Transcript_3275/m.5946 type:complete len:415 (-) Transcript_3275:53-1297(-)
MAGAELVDAQLRSGVRAARPGGHRCFKALIVGGTKGGEALGDADGRSGQRTLALANAMAEVAGASLDSEFSRCVTALVDDTSPSLFLFRTDTCENVDGSRWLLVAWLPDRAPEAERAVYVRSRSLLARLVPQPYFLREFLAEKREDLSWNIARVGNDVGEDVWSAALDDIIGGCISGSGLSTPMLKAPLQHRKTLAGLLQRLANREDPCLQMLLSSSGSRVYSGRAGAAITLEAQANDSRSPTQLAQARLPGKACYFVMPMRDHVLFFLWCPDTSGVPKDHLRIAEDTRYAVLKTSVIRLIVEAFPDPKPYVAQVEAREQADIVEGAAKAAEKAKRAAIGTADLPYMNELNPERRHNPAQAVPSTMSIESRPFPPWRGGSKSHTISSGGGPSTRGLGGVAGAISGRRATVLPTY